jgi:hypothetical protein
MLTYSNISARVSHSFINGQCLMADYAFTQASGLNTTEIIHHAKQWQTKIAQFGH